MAIFKKGDNLPTAGSNANGFVINGGFGRARIGNVHFNIQDLPFGKTTAGSIHVLAQNLTGAAATVLDLGSAASNFELLGSAYIDLEVGAAAAAERIHIGTGSFGGDTAIALLGGKGQVDYTDTHADADGFDAVINLFNLTGKLETTDAATNSFKGRSGSTLAVFTEL